MDEQVYYDLIEGLVDRIKTINHVEQSPWINVDKALEMLSLTSQTTLKKFCDQGYIEVSKPSEKIVLYNRDSILQFLKKNVKKVRK